MAEIHDLNVTDASNTARFPENMAPSAVNNSARALEGLVARYFFDNDTSVVATISASLITIVANRNSLTLTGTTSNYVANYMQAFTMGGNPNTGPVRVTVDGVGPISLRDNTGASLTSSVLLAGSRALMVKDGTNNYFRLIYPTVTSGYSDPLTTRGDILHRNSSNATARLAVGSNGYILKSDGTDVAWAAASSGPSQATAGAIEGETNEDTYLPPDLVRRSPGVCKGWALCDTSGNATISYNVTSCDDNGTGDMDLNWATDFSSGNHVAIVTGTGAQKVANVVAFAAGSTEYENRDIDSHNVNDPVKWMCAVYGDQ
mgnify:CR=1 FL=1